MLDKILEDTQEKLDRTLRHLKEELAAVRTSRANPSIIGDLEVSAYGTTLKLKELAALSAPEPSEIIIQPWDETTIKPIEKALLGSQLGLNPVVEGNLIRIPVPPLSKERREEFLKIIGQKCEAARISVRNIRQAKIKTANGLKEEGKISEDEYNRFKAQIQKLIDEYNQKVHSLRSLKEKEILN